MRREQNITTKNPIPTIVKLNRLFILLPAILRFDISRTSHMLPDDNNVSLVSTNAEGEHSTLCPFAAFAASRETNPLTLNKKGASKGA